MGIYLICKTLALSETETISSGVKILGDLGKKAGWNFLAKFNLDSVFGGVVRRYSSSSTITKLPPSPFVLKLSITLLEFSKEQSYASLF